MLQKMLDCSSFDSDRFLHKPAIAATQHILRWGDISRVKIIFLHENLGRQLHNLDFFRILIKEWRELGESCQDWDLVFGLIDHMSDIMVKGQWGNELLCIAAGAGCVPLARQLIRSAQESPELQSELLREQIEREEPQSTFEVRTHQSVGEAVLGNQVEMVRYLLGQSTLEAHLHYRNTRGENVLHLASRLCNPDMFRVLIPCFPEGIHQANNEGDTALVQLIKNSSASGNRHDSATVLLLQSGTKWNELSWDGQQHPLRLAAQLGDLEMCDLLVSIGGMDPLEALEWDSKGRVTLKDRNPQNADAVPQILQLLCSHVSPRAGFGPFFGQDRV